MGQIAKAFGLAGEVEWQGKTYKLSPMGKKAIQAQFELWMEARALSKAKALAATMPAAEAAQFLQDVRHDIGAGVYSFVGGQSGKALLTQPGQVQLVYLLIHDNHPEFTLDMAQQMSDEKLEEIMMKIDQAGKDDPNAQAPAN